MTTKNDSLCFRVSSGLKNIIGRDLISDKYIAVFELVKNSYDAGASKVDISFVTTADGNPQIIISDNGCGMTYDDIINKWLFVAYSEKKPRNHDKLSYRDSIKREVAGAKGVGRFSCDRLGSNLTLITKTKSDVLANQVVVDWNNFELDDTQEFVDIPVTYSTVNGLPSGYSKGTSLIVDMLREDWSREELLRLKRSLMKLISPDANKGDLDFDIELIVPSEREKDSLMLKKESINPDRDIVNGIIHNDIFEKLNIKTTSIEVNISPTGEFIESKLTDRGEYIFSVVEKNRNYYGLKDISITIFYLNQSAKISFTRQMGGVQPKNYGSVFIYKNGFRINPYGEPGQDFFGIDQRKAQGYNRYLGTREIMGRISIKGENNQFVETTSRAHGFIQTPSVSLLSRFFLEKALKILEKYVVNLINWGEPLKNDPNHVISPGEIGSQIISQFISNVDGRDIVNIDYNANILTSKISSDNSDNISASIKKLENVAEQTRDSNLINLAKNLKAKTESILAQNVHLEKENLQHSKDLAKAKENEKIREKQIYFLNGTSNQSVKNLINGFHSVYTLTDASRGNIDFLREQISSSPSIPKEDKGHLLSIVGEIMQANEKAHKISDMAIHGNQSLKQSGSNSINDFIHQYISAGFAMKGLKYDLVEDSRAFNCKFDSSSIGIVIDNISSNSIKAGATILQITLSESNSYVEISFADNGMGLSDKVDPNSLFEWGLSSNRESKGFGIGLYHVKQLVEEMKGSAKIDLSYQGGFKLVVRLKK